MLISGFVSLLVLPFALIIMCVSYVGLPLAGFTALILSVLLFFSRVFTFASIGRYLMFFKSKKRFSFLVEVILATLPAALIREIPILGGLVGFVCVVYTLGYVVQASYLHLNKKRAIPITED